ncbi:MAG: hypothetical protein KAI17_27790, partial [Thiotrichaceae bacterium]|nr:hypothetical protein [Thiotrichaceae bacterium]
ADLVKILPSSYDQIYARWYIKWRDGYNFNDHNHGGGLHAGGRQYLGRSDYRPAGDDWFSAWIEPDVNTHTLYSYSYYRGMYMNCADPSGSCWGDMFPCTTDEGRTFCEKPEHREQFLPDELEDNRWYCVEMFLDGGVATSNEANATGKLNFWVDGVEMGAWDNLWFRTNDNIKINTLWLNLFHHGEHSPAGVMYDHVAVSTQRIGCY